jgi:hypothetical protein
MVVAVASIAAFLAFPQVDSTALARRVRNAQSAFETGRRVRLPTALGGTSGECELRIGRFCYWYDPSEDPPRPEPPRTDTERDRLLGILDSVATLLPGDDWVAGQRVRYLLEAGRPDAAIAAARGCTGTPWWCAAIEGLARHEAGDFGAAERAFQLALAEMPAKERCRWTDLSALLEASLRRSYRRLGCEAREELNARIWWLARPLLAPAGNDRRTEHFARLTMARIWRHSASPFGSLQGDDVTELIVRYGWPQTWSQRSTSSLTADRTVIGTEREPSYHFLPDSLAAPGSEPGSIAPLAQERYAPAYADTFEFFQPEFSAFRRGESTLVVAYYDVAGDTLFRDAQREAALALGKDEATAPVVVRRPNAPTSAVLVAEAPWTPQLSSVEITAPLQRRVARGRVPLRSLRPQGERVVVSDLLAFTPQDSLPTDLVTVLPHVRSLLDVPAGARVGLYWEVYGLAVGGETLTTSVSVTPERVGWLRRVAGSVGLAGRQRRVQLEWSEAGTPRGGVSPRALVVDLATLPPGAYRIEVRVRPEAGNVARATRLVRIEAH